MPVLLSPVLVLTAFRAGQFYRQRAYAMPTGLPSEDLINRAAVDFLLREVFTVGRTEETLLGRFYDLVEAGRLDEAAACTSRDSGQLALVVQRSERIYGVPLPEAPSVDALLGAVAGYRSALGAWMSAKG